MNRITGIPVYANGDPVNSTVVVASNYQHFNSWAMYSRVNPNSKMIKLVRNALGSTYRLHGIAPRTVDMVFYGPWYEGALSGFGQEMHMWESILAPIKTWHQFWAYLIDPDVVD